MMFKGARSRARLQAITDALRAEPGLSVADVATRFKISHATARLYYWHAGRRLASPYAIPVLTKLK